MHGQLPEKSITAVELEGVSRQLGRDCGVFGLSLVVPQGEILSIIGQTGAGKSTVLRIVAGLEKIDSGRLMILKKDANGLKPNERNLSLIFQKDIFYPGQPLEKDWHKAEADGVFKMLSFKGLTPEYIMAELRLNRAFLKQSPETYSGGQARRASLLRAILQNRDLILADEPLNGLDLATRDRVARLLWRFIKATGKTLIIVAHEPADALGLADRIAVMHQGRLLQVGPVETILNQPNHLEILSLLHFPPWNEITDNLHRQGQYRCFVPAQACWAEVAVDEYPNSLPMRFLRTRWSQESAFAEWICPHTQHVFRTPVPDHITPQAVLRWKPESVIWFDAITGLHKG